ncbi:MAG: DUF1697 domain-containing protein [Geothrix sp.]|nr:DUF1697 domain-containing protein [Geothrix sp.]
MSRTFAFLRAINVGGHTVTMGRLKELFERLGLQGVETFITSGNVAFEGGTDPEAALRGQIEDHLRRALGYDVETFLRTQRELSLLVKRCPFDAPAVASAKALNVALLHAPLPRSAEARLRQLETAVDTLRPSGREVWWLCQVKQSESRFSNAVFEKALGLKATFRGFSTLQRLAAKYQKA